MDQVMQMLATAVETDGGNGGISPLFFVAGALALIVVSTLGPLSRIHERRSAERRAAAGSEVSGSEVTAVHTEVTTDRTTGSDAAPRS